MSTDVDVEILGQKFKIRGDATSDYTQQLARYVDSKMREIIKAAPSMPLSKAALMAAFNVADDYFKAKGKYEDLGRTIDKEATRLIEKLEKEIPY